VLLPLLAGPAALALSPSDIPADAPQDAVMATPEEIQEIQDWASAAFTGHRAEGRAPAVGVELRRQDHSSLGYGRSCIDTPIKLGQRSFKHGLGTHANSEIVLHLPPDARQFRSFVGIDNNLDTGGVRGSVQFSVEIAGKEVFRTPTLFGSNAPVPVRITLPKSTRELTLKVDSTPDGPGYDQADWAGACIITREGKVCWADEDREPLTRRMLPFSFNYGSAASSTFLKDWQCTVKTTETLARVVHEVSWTDSITHLRVSPTVSAFKRYPAVEWVLEFENLGTEDAPLLEQVQALDVQLRTGYFRKPVQLHHLVGDVCSERSFLPLETEVEPSKRVVLAPEGGRPSNGAFPFFNVQYGDEGMITAIGWSGQWRASLERSATGPTTLRAGMENLSLRLDARTLRPAERGHRRTHLPIPYPRRAVLLRGCSRDARRGQGEPEILVWGFLSADAVRAGPRCLDCLATASQ
jgi:hypothetical protein